MQIQVTQSVGPSKFSMGCGYVVMAVLLAGGLGLLVLASNNYERYGRPTKEAVIPGITGALLVLGSGGFLKMVRRQVRESAAEAARRAQFPGQPWKWKAEWQKPYLESDAGAGAAGLWVFAVAWNAFSFPVAWLVLQEGPAKKGAYFVLLFPVVGVLVLCGAIYQTIKWRKFGRTRFVPSGLPGVIGGYLGGVIEVPARVLPDADARLTLKCIRREVRGSGKNRSVRENVLWEREENIARDQWSTGVGGTSIPVLFYIPAGSAATDDRDRNNEIVWRLAASAAVPGVDFATQFKVPVFVTGETAAAPETGAPLLPEYSAQPLDATALAACGVRHEGDGFHFSASHLPGMKATTAVLQLGIFALLGWFLGRDIPGMVWGVTLFFGLILSLFTASVWFSRFELRLDGADVVVTKPRPWGTKITRLPRAEVKRVKHDRAMASGENQYYNLSLVGAEGVDPGVTVQGGEDLAARKLRLQIEQLQQQGQLTPAKVKELGGQVLAERKVALKGLVQFAAHIPGQAKAEAIAAMVLQAIRGGK